MLEQVPVRGLVVVGMLASAVLLGGCTGDGAEAGAGRPTASATPQLGGRTPDRHSPPARAMNRLEKPVARRLSRQVERQGLTLDYLDCPPWNGAVPTRLTCRGFVDGLVADVALDLRRAVEGRAVSFDARLGDGVIAVRTLERTLRRQGSTSVDCGDVAAYPATVGSTIVCEVTRRGERSYVVATVTGRSGSVSIADYRPGSQR